jgi:heptosyltransferase-2
LSCQFNRILVIRGGAIGDFILTLPAIKALRDANPHAHIEVLGYKQIAELAENRFYAQRVRSIESASLARFFAADAKLPAEVAADFAEFDLIISYLYDPDRIFETNLKRTGAKEVVHGPAKIRENSHAARQLADPIETIGIQVRDLAPKLFPSNEDRHRAREFLAGLDLPIVAFHPGSGSDRKNWPLERWIELGNHFLSTSGRFQTGEQDQSSSGETRSLVVVIGEADDAQAARLQSIWKNSRVRFARNLPLTNLAAVLENTVFVGHDSGISHLAAAAGAKSILLFGSSDPAVWAPLNENVRVIRAPDGDLQQLDVDLVRAKLDQELMRIGMRT